MKTLAYAAWLIVSLVVLAVLRDVARSEFPEYTGIVMGVAFAAVIYGLIVIRRRFSEHQRFDGTEAATRFENRHVSFGPALAVPSKSALQRSGCSRCSRPSAERERYADLRDAFVR